MPSPYNKISDYSSAVERSPIETFAIRWDMLQELANCLVGRNERETKRNIKAMIAYIESVHQKNQNGNFVLMSPDQDSRIKGEKKC